MKAVITLEDSMEEDEVEVTYELFGDNNKLLKDMDERSPAIDQAVAVIKFLELLADHPDDGVSHADLIN